MLRNVRQSHDSRHWYNIMDDTFFMDASLRHQQRFEFTICSVMLFRIVDMMCLMCWYIKYAWATASEQPGLATPYVVIRESLQNALNSGVETKKQLLSAKSSTIGRDSWQGSTLCSLGRWHLGWNRWLFLENTLGDFLLAWKHGYRMDTGDIDWHMTFLKFCIDIWLCIYYTCFMCICAVCSNA